MSDDTTRWSVTVPKDLDTSIRELLAEEGFGRNIDLSPYVEEAMRTYIFDRSVARMKADNGHLSPKEIEDLVDESVAWARTP